MLEFYKSSDKIYIDRSAIIDLAFIIPMMAEVESGMFFLLGAENTFCTRYIFDNIKIVSSPPSFYFHRYMVEPLGVRVFTVLNTLSQHLRRTMYHQAESVISKNSFHLPLYSMEAFWYLVYRIGGKG
jgi:hypothetical protein